MQFDQYIDESELALPEAEQEDGFLDLPTDEEIEVVREVNGDD